MKPEHTHDCTKCIYLGSTALTNITLDWYLHGDTVVARMSNKGSDYWSMMVSMVNDDKYLEATYYGKDNSVLVGMNILARFMLQRHKEGIKK